MKSEKAHKRQLARKCAWRLRAGLFVLLLAVVSLALVSWQMNQRVQRSQGHSAADAAFVAFWELNSIARERALALKSSVMQLEHEARHVAYHASGHVYQAATVMHWFASVVIEPVLQLLVGLAAFFSSLVASDRLFHMYTFVYYRYLSKHKPEHRYRLQALPNDESQWPHVAIQIPMFNENIEVIDHVVDCCCSMDWPGSKLTVQVCDDSTDELTQSHVADKVHEWKEAGIEIQLCWRANRQGFKAGALAEATEKLLDSVEYIAVFDADFAPKESFLKSTVPWLMHNPQLGFVQTRWTFANPDESMLTKVQEISLNFHVKVEQYARCAVNTFFNNNGVLHPRSPFGGCMNVGTTLNVSNHPIFQYMCCETGTAGVWSRACINDAGGWNARTTVEDMDLSLRAYLKGWRFLFLVRAVS